MGIEEEIYVLSMHQPWASLLARGAKTIETRSWPPPDSLVGQRIAIHATKQVVQFSQEDVASAAERALIERFNQRVAHHLGRDWHATVPTGSIIATATVRGRRMVRYEGDLPDNEDERLFGEYAYGRWLWHMDQIEELEEPIPARGYPTLWKWRPEGHEPAIKPDPQIRLI